MKLKKYLEGVAKELENAAATVYAIRNRVWMKGLHRPKFGNEVSVKVSITC